jgi:hypothetical protein
MAGCAVFTVSRRTLFHGVNYGPISERYADLGIISSVSWRFDEESFEILLMKNLGNFKQLLQTVLINMLTEELRIFADCRAPTCGEGT